MSRRQAKQWLEILEEINGPCQRSLLGEELANANIMRPLECLQFGEFYLWNYGKSFFPVGLLRPAPPSLFGSAK